MSTLSLHRSQYEFEEGEKHSKHFVGMANLVVFSTMINIVNTYVGIWLPCRKPTRPQGLNIYSNEIQLDLY